MADGPEPLTRGCFMTQGLYLKANGELPCWDDVGEEKILRKLDPEALRDGRELEISRFPALAYIRRAFARGEYPHPGLCDRCAVRSAGLPHGEIDPGVLQVVHVEPSYMCHLSCPQCVPQKLRKSLKDPPWHLDAAMYEGFLSQLRAEGIHTIKLVIFEGRGEPLACKDLEQIIALTKQYYPSVNTCVTTHGSFPYKPWIIGSKLDMIRFSVDGAWPESYAKYRIGGKLEMAFAFMEGLKRDRRPGSRLYVEWKYILFEWNDSDEELIDAGEIAQRLGVQLRFVRTHTPGRSLKYTTARQVVEMIERLAPCALPDLTFQLKEDADFARVDVVRGDEIRALIGAAEKAMIAGDAPGACAAVLGALALDRGIRDLPAAVDGFDALESLLGQGADMISRPETAAMLLDLFRRLGRRAVARKLLDRYATLSPFGSDRRELEVELGLEEIVEAHNRGDDDAVDGGLDALLAGGRHADVPGLVAAAHALDHPGLAAAMANILERRGELPAAALMFERYLELAPEASDRDRVVEHLEHISRLRVQRAIDQAERRARAGDEDGVSAAVIEALALDGGIGDPAAASGGLEGLAPLLDANAAAIALSVTAGGLSELFRRLGRRPLARKLLDRYAVLAPEAPDLRDLEIDLALEDIVEAHGRGDGDDVDRRLGELGVSLAAPARVLGHPGLAAAMANIAESRGHLPVAAAMFVRYLELAPDAADRDEVVGHIAHLTEQRLRQAMAKVESSALADNENGVCAATLDVLAIDGGLRDPPATVGGFDELAALLDANADAITHPLTAAMLIGLCRRRGQPTAARRLLDRYIALAPEGLDRRPLEIDLALDDVWRAHVARDHDDVDRGLEALLANVEHPAILRLVAPAHALGHAGLATAVANIVESRGHLPEAIRMFERYLELAPDAGDHDLVARHISHLRMRHAMPLAAVQARAGNATYATSLASEAISHDIFAHDEPPAPLIESVRQAVSKEMLEKLGEIAEETGDDNSRRLAEHRLGTEPELL